VVVASGGGGALMAFCPSDPAQGLVERLFGVVDCHIRVLAHDSYRDLVGPGTLFANVFTVMLTIYIALMGYQLLFGRGGLRLAQMPVEALKIGLILAFTTSWATYQTVVYDLFFDGPRQLLGVMLGAAGRGETGDLYLGLERAYQRLSEAASIYGGMASPTANILQGGPMLGSGLLWLSAVTMLLSTVGLILAAKIVLGFLLALGPIFVGLFLFDATRGFFDGWVRTIVAFAIAPLAASVFGAGLLMMLEPFLAPLLELAKAGRFDMGAVITIVLIVAVFALVMMQVLRISASLANGFRTTRRDAEPAPTPQEGAAPATSTRSERSAEIAARLGRFDAADAPGSAMTERRIDTMVDAVNRDGTRGQERLAASYSRMPRPTRRPGDAP
jgi:type IV secretion system protein VirB6